MKRPLTYLACPYTHPDPSVQELRFILANRAAGQLMKEGSMVFSPISHSHPIALAAGLPGDWEYWKKFARAYLEHSHRIVVLCLDGWEQSVGVTEELQIANELGIQIEYLEHATKAHSAN